MTRAIHDNETHHAHRAARRAPGAIVRAVAVALAAIAGGAALPAGEAHAQLSARDQAKRMHDRLNGAPPSAAVLDLMESDIAGGNRKGAALRAIDNPNGHFYTVVLKNWAMPWTNRDQTAFAPLNDYVATVIGMVRDDVPFNQLLSADIIYVGGSGASGVPAYNGTSNDHYEQIETRGLNLRDPAVLARASQSAVLGLPAPATAGVMTSRAAARAFFVAGTNRAMFRFTLMAHLCRDLEQTMDVQRPTDRIRQDVSRSPGGDSRLFLGNCAGCHTGMDPMAQAFAYYNYGFTGDEATGRIEYTAGVVQPKYFNNDDTFKQGFRTTDDRWENRWRKGPNSLLGWDPALPGTGQGAKSLGAELGNSDAFAQCQVQKVFKAVCLRNPSDAADRSAVASIVASFKSGYSLKNVWADTAAYCTGE